MSPSSSPTPLTVSDNFLDGNTIRLLVVGDPFATALQKAVPELSRLAGGPIDIEVVGYNDVRQLTLLNARDQASAYDIVSFDVVWLGEYGQQQVLLPLNDKIAATPDIAPQDFLTCPYQDSRYQGQQLGLPIQPHPELLWYRTDLLAEANLLPPTTTDELLQAAAILNKPDQDQYGICWNGQRGQPLGQQMAHFYAAFGQPLLDEAGRPTLNTAQGVAAARYAQALLAYAPPDILNMAWDRRISRFAQGGCAMTYGWGARSYLVEEDPTSQVAGLVGYHPPPHAPNSPAVTPVGTWSLGIPANIGPREELAWQFLSWLTSSDIQKLLADYGNGGMPRVSVLQEPALAQRYPAFETALAINQQQQCSSQVRPAVPFWPALAEILGTTYHDMLTGQLSPQQAADQAQQQAEQLLSQE